MIRGTMIASVIGLMAAIASSASADCGKCEKKIKCDKCEVKCPKPCCKKEHADIEKLTAVKGDCSGTMCVKYQVEISHFCPDSTKQYDLVLQVKDRCKKVVWERTIELGAPCSESCHKRLYAGNFSDELACAEGWRIEGNVVERGTSCSLDKDNDHLIARDHGALNSVYKPIGVNYRRIAGWPES